MKIRDNKKLRFWYLCVLTVALFAQACGDEKQAPFGSEIIFTSGDYSASISAETCANFQILVQYSDGTPMPNAQVNIFGAFAFPRNTTNTNPRYQFYAYANCDVNPANFAVDSGFRVEVGDNGTHTFSALISDPTVTFTDTIYAYSGSSVGTAGITIQ
jgi:hypothetical protein